MTDAPTQFHADHNKIQAALKRHKKFKKLNRRRFNKSKKQGRSSR